MKFLKPNLDLRILSNHRGIHGRMLILYLFLRKNNFKMTHIVISSLVSLIIGIAVTVLLYQWSPLVTAILMYLGGFMSVFYQAVTYSLSEDGARYSKFLEDNLDKLKSLSRD